MDELTRRLRALPENVQKLIAADMKTALKNRITVMERICNKTTKS